MKVLFISLRILAFLFVLFLASCTSNLHNNIRKTDIEAVRKNLADGADINKRDPFGNTPLIYSIAVNRFDIAKLLIKNGANVNLKNMQDLTALYYSIANKRTPLDVIEMLIQKGADVDQKYAFGSLLSLAVLFNKSKVFDLLIQYNADLDIPDKNGLTPLYLILLNRPKSYQVKATQLIRNGANVNVTYKKGFLLINQAIQNRDYKIIKLMIENGANVNAKGNLGTPIEMAVRSGHKLTVKLLIKNGADINGARISPLFPALKSGDKEMISLLLKNRINVNVKDKNNYTPLILAAMNNTLDIFLQLLRKGANVHAIDKINGKTALHWSHSDKRIILLLQYGADINAEDYEGNTRLILACHYDTGTAELLIKHGANTNRKNKNGETALHYSTKYRNPKITKTLIKYGAEINVTDNNGNTPLINSVKNYSEKNIELLIRNGANINTQDKDGRTVLHWVAKRGGGEESIVRFMNSEVDLNVMNIVDKDGNNILLLAAKNKNFKLVKFLINNGANINVKNNNGETILDWAIKHDNSEMIDIIEKKNSEF